MSDTSLAPDASTQTTTTDTTSTDTTQTTTTDQTTDTTTTTSVADTTDRDWSKAVNPDGSFDAKAHEYGMPEHWKSIGAVVDGYKDLQRMKGMPGAEATPEQISSYRQANGVPEVVNAEAYGLQLPDELKDSVAPESLDRIVKAANDNAHLGHIEMMQAVVSEFSTIELENLSANNQDNEAAQTERLSNASAYLEKDQNFSGQNRKAALQTTANGLNSALGDLGVASDSPEAQQLRGFLAENPLGTRILHHFISKTSQDGVPGGDATQDMRSREELADSIMTNPNDPLYKAFHDDAHEGHDKAVKAYWAHMGVAR